MYNTYIYRWKKPKQNVRDADAGEITKILLKKIKFLKRVLNVVRIVEN